MDLLSICPAQCVLVGTVQTRHGADQLARPSPTPGQHKAPSRSGGLLASLVRRGALRRHKAASRSGGLWPAWSVVVPCGGSTALHVAALQQSRVH